MKYDRKKIRSVVPRGMRSRRFRVLALILLTIVLGLGLVIAPIERSNPEAVIKSEWDGVYFAITTVTGVGYGDLVPMTDMGRVVTLILETVGVVLFGSIVAMVAVELLRYQEDYYARRMFDRLSEVEGKVDEVRKHVDYLVKK